MDNKPRLTLALNCYKVERFVAEAVEGAFAQTYRPLEIVISDDHSADATWEKIAATVVRLGGFAPSETEAWQKPDFCGTVELSVRDDLHLVLNRNEKNLGLAFHENKLFELSHGEWIAFQAGDDISKSMRMELVAEMVEKDSAIRCIECRSVAVDENLEKYAIPERILRQQLNRNKSERSDLPYILGAGAVYHRDVYGKFGPLGVHVANEDHVLPLRAALLGTINSTEEVLVLYRKHGDNASGAYNPTADSIAKFRQRMMFMYYQELVDLHHAEVNGIADLRLIDRYRRLVQDRLFAFGLLSEWHTQPRKRVSLVFRLFAHPRQMFLFAVKALRRLCGRFC